MSKHQPDQGVHGDGSDGGPPQPGESLRESLRRTQPGTVTRIFHLDLFLFKIFLVIIRIESLTLQDQTFLSTLYNFIT